MIGHPATGWTATRGLLEWAAFARLLPQSGNAAKSRRFQWAQVDAALPNYLESPPQQLRLQPTARSLLH
jgi:hypothetical protein